MHPCSKLGGQPGTGIEKKEPDFITSFEHLAMLSAATRAIDRYTNSQANKHMTQNSVTQRP